MRTLVSAALLALIVSACGKDESTSDDGVNVMVSMESSGMALAQSALSDARLCFKRLRFKTAEEDAAAAEDEAALTGKETSAEDKAADDAKDDADGDNVDFDVGEVALTDEGNVLGTVTVPEGDYRRIEIDLDKKCNGYSVKLTNAAGTFQTDDRVKIKFRGDFAATDATANVALVTDGLLAALEAVTDGEQIRDAIGDPSGIVKNK